MIVAIDPGIRGAAAALRDNHFHEVIDIPVRTVSDRTEVDIPSFSAWICMKRPRRIIIENVHSFPKEGSVGAFRFGVAVGMLRAISEMWTDNVEFVEPAVWKLYFDLIHCEKDQSRELALSLWPNAAPLLKRVKDGHRAEAMLIAWWAVRPAVGKNW